MPALDALTQGATRAEAARMAVAWIRDMLDAQGLDLAVTMTDDGFTIAATDPAPVIALMLRRQREAAGLSLAEVSARLGAASRNAYARYEQGRSVPTVTQLDRLMAAINPERGLCLA
jgi:predicted transcriptional regulator